MYYHTSSPLPNLLNNLPLEVHLPSFLLILLPHSFVLHTFLYLLNFIFFTDVLYLGLDSTSSTVAGRRVRLVSGSRRVRSPAVTERMPNRVEGRA